MGYRIDFTSDARKHLATLPRKIQEQIGRKIDALADNPRPGQSKRLAGADYLYRVRSGDYRIVYQVEEEVVTVLIVRIGNRRDVYRNLPMQVLVRRPPVAQPRTHRRPPSQ